MNKKILSGVIAVSFLISGFAYAQTADIAALQKIIDDLRAQIAQLTQSQQQSAAQISALQSQLRLSRNLRQGQSGEDVKLLQQTLATDPSIFSGPISGFFGRMTSEAVKKLQERLGLEQTGDIGPQTRGELNQLFGDVSSSTGALPAGLLRGGFAPLHFALFPVGEVKAEGEVNIFPIDASSSRVAVHFATENDLSAGTSTATYTTHIHSGACASSGPVSIPLSDILHNKSETTINKTIGDLFQVYPLSIMVHQGGAVVACGDFTAPRPIYRKMDINHDGRIDSKDMMEIDRAERKHQQEEDEATSTDHRGERDRQGNDELRKKFEELQGRLWNRASGLLPDMMRGDSEDQRHD